MNERRRKSGELREACKRSSTSGHRHHTTTIQPYQPRLKPPCSASPFHSFASILSLLFSFRSHPVRAIATSTRCSFQRSFPAEPLVSPSFRRCTAAYNEWRTSSKALRFYSFLSSRLSFPVPVPSYTSLIFRLYFFPRHPSSCRARWFDLLSFSAPLFPTHRPSLHHENKWGAHVKAKKKKETSFLCCKLERTGLPCFFYDTVFPWCRHLRGWFRAALASWFPNEFSSRRFVDRSRLNASFPRNISLRFFNAFFARTRYVCIFYLERAEYLQFIVAM